MNCEELKSSVLRWFGEEIECHATDPDTLVATLTLLKPNGDPIDIGLENIGGNRWRVSDLGDTYSSLFLGGVEISDAMARGYEFNQIVEAHRIRNDGNELSVEVSQDELIEQMFDFVQAIQSMLALQFTVKPDQPARDFSTIVAKFLAEQRASFEVATSIEGKTGRWKFNFVLNHVREETLVKTVSVSNRTQAIRSAEESVFEINDVQELRKVGAVVSADDEGERVALWGQSVLRIFEGYGIPLYRFEASRGPLIELAKRYAMGT